MRVLDDRGFLKLLGIMFAFMCSIHLTRIFFGWPIFIGVVEIPVSWSYFGAFLAFFLSTLAFNFSKYGNLGFDKKKKKNAGKKNRSGK